MGAVDAWLAVQRTEPEKLQAFTSFIEDVVRRYSIPPYNVQYWEIGNEPDIAPEQLPSDMPFGCWGKTGDPIMAANTTQKS